MVNTKGDTFYTISEIASELKVDKRSIRFCEEKGLISPKVKTLNRRTYSEYDRARLELILHCEASGCSFDHVVDLIGTPDPDLNKVDQFRKGLEYAEKRLDELIKQSEEMSFHQRTSIMTDINLMRQYVKNLQALKTKILVEYKAKPRRPEEEVELEPTVAPESVETVRTEPEEKATRQPTRMVPAFTAGIVLILMIAGYFYYQKRTKDTKSIDLAQNQTVTMEATSSNQDSVPSAITANQDDVSTQAQELSSSTPLSQQDRLEESKELIDNVSSESQKETKIVLSKADPDAQEKPIAQEQIKEEAEITQPVAEQPSEPDTKDEAADQATEPETKGATVAAVAAATEDQPSVPDAATPALLEETAPKPETPEPAQAPAPEPETPEPVATQEKPIAQEQIKEEAEITQPVAEQPSEPDTKDEAADQATEPETKGATVAAATEDQPPTPDAATPAPSEETAPKPEIPEPAQAPAPEPAAQEKPTTQEPTKKEAETTQPVAEQPPEPDTKDEAADQATEPETKGATVAAVAAVAEDQPSAPDAATPAPSEETAPKPETPEPAQAAAPEPEIPEPAQAPAPEPEIPEPAQAPAPEPETPEPAAQEKPPPQEPIKKEAETTQPVAEQPSEPDTKDEAADQATEPETKGVTVAAATEESAPTPDAATPAPSEETAPKPEAQEPAATQETSVAATTEDTSKPENHTSRLKAFLANYCSIYETKDLDRFFSLFTADATENDTPFNELRPKYQKNMEIIESFQYRIDMIDYSSIPETGNTLVQGNFIIKYRLQGKSWKEHSGNVTMELTDKGDSYLVKRLNYGD